MNVFLTSSRFYAVHHLDNVSCITAFQWPEFDQYLSNGERKIIVRMHSSENKRRKIHVADSDLSSNSN